MVSTGLCLKAKDANGFFGKQPDFNQHPCHRQASKPNLRLYGDLRGTPLVKNSSRFFSALAGNRIKQKNNYCESNRHGLAANHENLHSRRNFKRNRSGDFGNLGVIAGQLKHPAACNHCKRQCSLHYKPINSAINPETETCLLGLFSRPQHNSFPHRREPAARSLRQSSN